MENTQFVINVPLVVSSWKPAACIAAATAVLRALRVLGCECSGSEFFTTGSAPVLPREGGDDNDVHHYLLVTCSTDLNFQAAQKFIAGCYDIAAELPDGYLQLKARRYSDDIISFAVGPKAHLCNSRLFNRADFVDISDAVHIMYKSTNVPNASHHMR